MTTIIEGVLAEENVRFATLADNATWTTGLSSIEIVNVQIGYDQGSTAVCHTSVSGRTITFHNTDATAGTVYLTVKGRL